MKICRNCAWFCHSDQKCYVPVYQNPVHPCRACSHWTSDGLTVEEREDLYALVTDGEVTEWQN